MSKSTHQIQVRAVDQTAGAFSSIKARAATTGASIRSMLGGALAAAGAYLGFRALTGTISNLGKLSDLSKKTGASVDEMTRAVTAFQVAGLNMSVDSFAKSMQYLEKNTGKIGLDAMFDQLKVISKIEDPAKRGAELMKNFGRGGMEFAPLIRGAESSASAMGDVAASTDQTIDKFRTLISLMPGISQAAADAGDAAADAQTIIGSGISAIWSKTIGKICAMWGEDFPGGVRAGALNAINYVEWFLKSAFNRMTTWGSKIALAGEAMWNWAANGYSWDDAWAEFGEVADVLDRQQGEQLAAIDKAREDYVAKLKSVDVDDLANVLSSKRGKIELNGDAAAAKIARVVNPLVAANSNDMTKLAILGPSLGAEEKKQTEILREIADNTKATPDDDRDLAVVDM